MKTRRAPWFFAVSCLAVLSACGGGPQRTELRYVADRPEPIPPGYAQVVFARYANTGSSETFIIVNDRGDFVGETPAETRLVVNVPEGKNTFVGWWHKVSGDYGQVSAVTGTLKAGEVYLVLVSIWFDGVELLALPRYALPCTTLDDVRATRRVEPADRPDESVLDPDGVHSQIQRAMEEIIQGSRQEMAFRHLDDPWTNYAKYLSAPAGEPVAGQCTTDQRMLQEDVLKGDPALSRPLADLKAMYEDVKSSVDGGGLMSLAVYDFPHQFLEINGDLVDKIGKQAD
jgi:hypothetical protein